MAAFPIVPIVSRTAAADGRAEINGANATGWRNGFQLHRRTRILQLPDFLTQRLIRSTYLFASLAETCAEHEPIVMIRICSQAAGMSSATSMHSFAKHISRNEAVIRAFPE